MGQTFLMCLIFPENKEVPGFYFVFSLKADVCWHLDPSCRSLKYPLLFEQSDCLYQLVCNRLRINKLLSELKKKVTMLKNQSLVYTYLIKSRTRLSNFTFTFHFHALEKEMATHSSVLALRIPGKRQPGWLPSMGSHRVGHD